MEHLTAIFGILNDIYIRNRRFWEVLEPIIETFIKTSMGYMWNTIWNYGNVLRQL